MAATATAVTFDVVKTILAGLGLLAATVLSGGQRQVVNGGAEWATIEQNANREAVVALPDYLRLAPLLLAETLPQPPSGEAEFPGLGRVVWGQHATDRHGEDAIMARAAAVAGGPGGLWRCHDRYNGGDKVYAIAQILERGSGGVRERWALVVLVRMADGRWAEKTAFLTDAAGIRRVLERDGCQEMNRFAHP